MTVDKKHSFQVYISSRLRIISLKPSTWKCIRHVWNSFATLGVSLSRRNDSQLWSVFLSINSGGAFGVRCRVTRDLHSPIQKQLWIHIYVGAKKTVKCSRQHIASCQSANCMVRQRAKQLAVDWNRYLSVFYVTCSMAWTGKLRSFQYKFMTHEWPSCPLETRTTLQWIKHGE